MPDPSPLDRLRGTWHSLLWVPFTVRQLPRWRRIAWQLPTPIAHSPLWHHGPTRRALIRYADWASKRQAVVTTRKRHSP